PRWRRWCSPRRRPPRPPPPPPPAAAGGGTRWRPVAGGAAAGRGGAAPATAAPPGLPPAAPPGTVPGGAGPIVRSVAACAILAGRACPRRRKNRGYPQRSHRPAGDPGQRQGTRSRAMSPSLSPTLLRRQALIDGRWCDADDGATFAVTNPASGETLVE